MDPEYAAIRQKAAARGKYAPLHRHLAALTADSWRASFRQVEEILGFRLPDSARLYPAWWSNGTAHSHALAWVMAGFRVRPALDDGAVVFERSGAAESAVTPGPPRLDLDREWPALPGNPWPEGFTGSREQIYEDDGR